MTDGPVGVGVIGAGNISDRYLSNFVEFPSLDVRFVADVVEDRARTQAERYGVPAWGSVDDLLADPAIRIVVNLTTPDQHVPVALRCVAAGKHVWTEKPFGADREEGRRLLAAADTAGVRVATAPDTFLGAGVQSARRLLEAGTIGRPMAATTRFQSIGPEGWHPAPQFLFQGAAGPLLDMGPYYLTALVQLFGPVARVTAAARRFRDQRVIGSGPDAGLHFDVTVPTFVTAIIEFESGQIAQTLLTFDSAIEQSSFEVYGVDGAIRVPNPDLFGGDVVTIASDGTETVLDTGTPDNGRGRGVVELVQALREGRPERASGRQAFHVLDVLLSIRESTEREEPVLVSSTFSLQPALPEGWDPRSIR